MKNNTHTIRTTLLLLFAFTLLFTMPLRADKVELDEIINGVQKRYEKVETYMVSFKQSLTSPVFKKVIREASGVIYFAKPGKIKWEYKTPDKHMFLIDGEYYWDYDPQNKQVMKIPIKDALAGDVPHGFLFGVGNLRKDFKVKLLRQSKTSPDKSYRLSLKPRDKNLRAAINDLKLMVKPEDFSVIGSSFTDVQGNVNEYKFSDIVINPKLDPELFNFKVPRGVKVILPITPSETKNP